MIDILVFDKEEDLYYSAFRAQWLHTGIITDVFRFVFTMGKIPCYV